jgi:hypothetical protein
MTGRHWLLAGLVALAVTLGLIWTLDARAETRAEWFKGLRQPDQPAQSCCDVSDCREDPDARYDAAQGLWITNLTDRRKSPNAPPDFTPVSPNKIVRDTASWEGKAYVCHNGHVIYCFIPPGGGS